MNKNYFIAVRRSNISSGKRSEANGYETRECFHPPWHTFLLRHSFSPSFSFYVDWAAWQTQGRRDEVADQPR
jgi:hypothetical protein